MLRDRAIITSLEIRVPLIQNVFWADFLELAPFVDFGRGWNRQQKTPEPKTFPVSASEYAGGSRPHGRLLSGLSSNSIRVIA